MTITAMETLDAPTYRYGLVITGVLVICHIAVTWLCAVFFATRTRHLLLNNAWQIFAEAPEIVKDELLTSKTGTSHDKTIRKEMVRQGRTNELWSLRAPARNGTTEKQVILRKHASEPERSDAEGIADAVPSSMSLQPLIPARK